MRAFLKTADFIASFGIVSFKKEIGDRKVARFCFTLLSATSCKKINFCKELQKLTKESHQMGEGSKLGIKNSFRDDYLIYLVVLT